MSSVNAYCKHFREKHGFLLREVGGGTDYETIHRNMMRIHQFEANKSSNMNHLKKYFRLAKQHGLEQEFLNGIAEAFNHD